MLKNIRDFLARHHESALIIAFVAAFLSLGSSVFVAYLSYHWTIVAQDRQAKIDALNKFGESGEEIVLAAGDFLKAINSSKVPTEEKAKIGSVVVKRLVAADNLAKSFPGSSEISAYEDALHRFNEVAQNTNSASEIKPWVEALDDVLTRQQGLRLELKRKA